MPADLFTVGIPLGGDDDPENLTVRSAPSRQARLRVHRKVLAWLRQFEQFDEVVGASDAPCFARAPPSRYVLKASEDPCLAALSPREREVAQLIARGFKNREIAARLSIASSTVKDHVHHILQKTGLRNRAAVAAACGSPTVT